MSDLFNRFPLKIPAIKIDQPMGEFYVANINSDILAKISYSIPATAVRDKDGAYYKPDGTQRLINSTRVNEIARYIESVEATFPNSIILGANYDPSKGILVEEDDEDEAEKKPTEKWHVEATDIEGVYNLIIPTDKKLASLIDGQHRLMGFSKATKNKPMDLLCAVYLDLPFPYHAYVFATINYNQKSVSRSLAYDLFGFDIDEEDPVSWVPETLAVSLARAFEGGGGMDQN